MAGLKTLAKSSVIEHGQLAAGHPSKQLVEMIERREAEYIELSAAERRRLDARLAEMRDDVQREREANALRVDMLAKELAKRGKRLRMAGAEKLAQLRARVLPREEVER